MCFQSLIHLAEGINFQMYDVSGWLSLCTDTNLKYINRYAVFNPEQMVVGVSWRKFPRTPLLAAHVWCKFPPFHVRKILFLRVSWPSHLSQTVNLIVFVFGALSCSSSSALRFFDESAISLDFPPSSLELGPGDSMPANLGFLGGSAALAFSSIRLHFAAIAAASFSTVRGSFAGLLA